MELRSVCSSEKVGDVVMWMVEDILPDLPSASDTQLEVSPEGARSPESSSTPMLEVSFESSQVRARESRLTRSGFRV